LALAVDKGRVVAVDRNEPAPRPLKADGIV
jgi:hypothetical protein